MLKSWTGEIPEEMQVVFLCSILHLPKVPIKLYVPPGNKGVHSSKFLMAIALTCTFLSSCAEAPSEFDRIKERDVVLGMRRVQQAVERYASDHGTDNYPMSVEEMKTYLPGGDEDKVKASIGQVNVFTSVNEFPFDGVVKDLHTARFGKRADIAPGKILYCPLNAGKAYAIMGGAHDGKALMDENYPGQVLVLSNLEED